MNFSFGIIVANPSVSTTGAAHVINMYWATAKIKPTQICKNLTIHEYFTKQSIPQFRSVRINPHEK